MPPNTAEQGWCQHPDLPQLQGGKQQEELEPWKYGDGSTLLISGSSFLPLEAFSVVKIHPRHVFYGDQDNPLQGQEWLTMQYKALGKETSKYSLKLFT